MEIQAADLRSPFERAYSLLQDDGIASKKIEDDLSNLVVELTRKYFGISSEVCIESGLQAAVSLINEGLLISSSGRIADTEWAEVFKEKGVRGIVEVVTTTIKEIASQLHRLEKRASVSEIASATFREILISFSALDWRKVHSRLINEMRHAQEQTTFLHLLEWLQNNTKVGRVYKLKERDLPDFMSLEDKIDYIIFLCCGVAAKDLDFFHIDDEVSKTKAPTRDFEACRNIFLRPKKFKEARLLYEELIEKIPPRLRYSLRYQANDWFKAHISLLETSKGAKKTKSARTVPVKPHREV